MRELLAEFPDDLKDATQAALDLVEEHARLLAEAQDALARRDVTGLKAISAKGRGRSCCKESVAIVSQHVVWLLTALA